MWNKGDKYGAQNYTEAKKTKDLLAQNLVGWIAKKKNTIAIWSWHTEFYSLFAIVTFVGRIAKGLLQFAYGVTEKNMLSS